ncbi:thioredoxin [Vulcanibacillus modesticaldus]|uniref:Thioredoxin n=1 Tax=Vulcanibacillus modesticaldus TaxID=337097 RepID=A0A1D2YWA0_9BACI|nr:thioredoxin domain-containing protein [Vulcanibacillus modesticaldus]OEF99971.1 thioredoxin [Vulcanibacillus modesticaldus]
MKDHKNPKYTNRLINEKSPYLLQHAHNPVDWYPWGPEAFQKAKREDKPIFLSIGYSTCHWCHVMERESFEDVEVSEYLNKHYIAIKVDREERPDIDHIYMEVCQAMTGHGGWPLTIIMTPDQKPFFSGTYFPKRSKYGRPGLMDVLTQINELWENDRSKIAEISQNITEFLQPKPDSKGNEVLTADIFKDATNLFERNFDETFGGFGTEPKFPTPHNYMFLLREWKRTDIDKALEMVKSSLKAMHQGGIYDHIGWGFSRYSVDKEWLVPHFEKMLYDNALLAHAYLETYQATQDNYFAEVAKQIFSYVKRVMTSPEGGFYSAEDADSEGVEGKFYVWSKDEIIDILGKEDGELICEVYGVTEKGNFEGKNILNLINRQVESIAKRKGMTVDELNLMMEKSRQKLFAYREQRIHPHKDDKILTSWNGLMISALAKGYAVLQDQEYLEMANNAVEFIEQRLVNAQGRILARYRDGHSDFLGYLDDYAFYIWGLHELFMASGEPKYLAHAKKLLDDTITLFWDNDNGGFYFYGSDSEILLTRPKQIYDGAIPSGNSVMLLNLIRHIRLTGESKYETYLDKLIEAFSDQIVKYPAGYSFFLLALQMVFGSSMEIVIVEGENTDEFTKLKRKVLTSFLPFAVFIQKRKENKDELNRLIPVHSDKDVVNEQSSLYFCENFTCHKPIRSTEEINFLK